MPKTYFKVGFLAILFCFWTTLPCQPSASAATPSGLQATPSVKEVVISAQVSQTTFPIHIRNNTQNKVTLRVSLVDFGTLDETGGVAFLGEKENLKRSYGLAGWASLDKSSLALLPGQVGEVGVTILNRDTLALGGHYGAVLFKLTAPQGNNSQKVQLDQVFSSLILAKKIGGETYNLSLNKVEQVKNIYTFPSNIKLRFYNSGNVHAAPSGSVRLLDPQDREVARGVINPEVGQVLPGNYRVVQTPLSPSQTAWVPGRYRIIVNYTFGGQGHSSIYTSSFIFLNGLGIAVMIGFCSTLAYAVWHRKQIRTRLGKLPFAQTLRSRKSAVMPKAKLLFILYNLNRLTNSARGNSMGQKITPNLWFDGAKEAVDFYVSVFPDSKVVSTVYYPKSAEEGLADFQLDLAGKELTIDFELGDLRFTAINAGPTFKFNPSISFMVNFDPSRDDQAHEHLDELWDKLIDGGEALMPLDEYPYSKRYGWVKDRYGLTWQLILTDPEGEPRPFIVPSLLFSGKNTNQAEEAINFYLSVFKDAELGTQARYTEDTGPAKAGSLMFADFTLASQWFAAMDSGIEQDFTFNEAVSLAVTCKDQAEIDYFWEKFSSVPESEQCGWCKDKYGVSWQIVPENMEELMKKPNAFANIMQMKKIVIKDF